MHICKGDISYECSQIKTYTFKETLVICFSIFEPVSHTDIAKILEDNTFYFHDEIFGVSYIYNENTKLVGLRIDYNADATCKITIKLIKGDEENERKI